MVQSVAAPDEIDRAVGQRDRLHSAAYQGNLPQKTLSRDPIARQFQRLWQRINSDHATAELFSQLTGFSPLPTAKVKKRHAWPNTVASWDLGKKGTARPAASAFIEPAYLRLISGEKWPEKAVETRDAIHYVLSVLSRALPADNSLAGIRPLMRPGLISGKWSRT